MKEIKFYKVNDAYGYMSNFAPYPFSDGNKIWPTSEHYFQAQKFLVPEIQEKIRLWSHLWMLLWRDAIARIRYERTGKM